MRLRKFTPSKVNAFGNWLTTKGKYQIFRDFTESNDVSDLIGEQNLENMVNVFETHRELLNLMCEYDQYLRNKIGPMNKIWQQYLDMVEILFDFRKSMRDGNWSLHIAASEQMLKYFFAYDCTNYARHFTFLGQANLICHKAILIYSKNFKKAILVSEGYLESPTASHQIKLRSRE